MAKARIAEVFESAQGEGLYLGERQLFVRFFGCNLSCRFCDTRINSFMEYEPKELLKEIKLYKNRVHSISYTGGEPLLQKDFLMEVLPAARNEGFKNYLETNGTLPGELKEVIDFIDILAMDIKLPSSSGMEGLWGLHRRFLMFCSRKEFFIKTIICSTTTESDLKEALKIIKEVAQGAVLVLQPNSYDNQAELAEKLSRFKSICAQEKVTSCIIPQMHKLVGIK
ncbi:MAG TPA: 7-carboxy-7-deazaguanine synthase QueE [Candidatus Margulisiibacteriota bacterium]|nr:7-carboxy-7-deazaguanine synthase QueE [Candidatus Margulisiibacteriota bacterium]